MKKLLLLLVLACCIGTASEVQAQIRRTTGKITIYFRFNGSTDKEKDWGDGYRVYAFNKSNTGKNNTWPGAEAETLVLGNRTYHYAEIDASLGSGTISIVINNGSGLQAYDWDGITGDKFFLISSWNDNDKKFGLTEDQMYYFCKSDGTEIDLLTPAEGYNWTYSKDGESSPYYFMIANQYAFKNFNTIDWTNQKNNIYSPGTADKELLFEKLSNESYVRNTGKTWVIPANQNIHWDFSFNFSDAWTPTNYSVSPYFTRTPSATSEGYMTYSYGSNAALPAGVTAYFATGLSEGSVTLTQKTGSLKANAGYMLQGTAGTEYKFYATDVAPTVTDEEVSANLLKPSVTATPITDEMLASKYYYFFSSQPSVAFYRLDAAATSAAGRAYLETTETIGSTAGAKLAFIIDDDETTSIKDIKATSFEENAPMYNLAGQRVANNFKGVVIQNGKKFIVK